MEVRGGRDLTPDDVGWEPDSLRSSRAARGPDARWRYVIIEEIVGPTAVLVSWSWPLADRHGRLFWPAGPDDDGLSVAVPVALLRSQLYVANGLLREPRCGDTFAAQVDGPVEWGREQPVDDLRRLFPGEVFDLSADAHAAVRLTHRASSAPVQRAPSGGPGAAATTTSLSLPRSAAPAPRLELGPPNAPTES